MMLEKIPSKRISLSQVKQHKFWNSGRTATSQEVKNFMNNLKESVLQKRAKQF